MAKLSIDFLTHKEKGDNRETHNPIEKWNPAISTIPVLATKLREGTQSKRGKEEKGDNQKLKLRHVC